MSGQGEGTADAVKGSAVQGADAEGTGIVACACESPIVRLIHRHAYGPSERGRRFFRNDTRTFYIDHASIGYHAVELWDSPMSCKWTRWALTRESAERKLHGLVGKSIAEGYITRPPNAS